MKKYILLFSVFIAFTASAQQVSKKRPHPATLPSTMTNNQLVDSVSSFRKIDMYFSNYSKKEFAIVTPGYGLVGIAYLYLKQGKNWVQIPMPVTNTYGVKNIAGIADDNDNIWIEVSLLEDRIVKTYDYNLKTKQFKELSSRKI